MTASECVSACWQALFQVSSLKGLSVWRKLQILTLKVRGLCGSLCIQSPLSFSFWAVSLSIVCTGDTPYGMDIFDWGAGNCDRWVSLGEISCHSVDTCSPAAA